MLLLKTCPRCHGDLQLRSDIAGKYLSCIQCGYTRDYPRKPVMPVMTEEKSKASDRGKGVEAGAV